MVCLYKIIAFNLNQQIKTNDMKIEERFIIGLSQAIASRGKFKGILKAKCPPINTQGAAVWQGIMFHSNPYKMGFGHILFMDEENKELYNHVVNLGKRIDMTNLDRDANALRSFGVM